MRLARRALFAALVMLVLCAAASAQTLRDENDPRNQSPSVGTGGPEGGPTGLFTIYDGATIRKGEFTFSIAYSNFDRDPGNVDISDIPLSFNVGLNDHIELFFKTNAYRGIKVNSPLNLSSFYLPNSQVNCGILSSTGSASRGTSGLCSPAAIVQFSTGPSVGLLGRLSVFRPLNNQPFVQFPFIGGSAGTFLQGPGFKGSPFGFPGFSASLSTPIASPNSGTFSAADNFPGIGSPVGSILPGIVLSTAVLPCTALTGACNPFGGGTPLNPLEVPTTFTIAPTYLPDAPFVNRLYGESSFTNYVAGAKIRLTSPNNPLGVGVIPFYRWYPDRGNSFSGFNQMQRGAGPGGSIGDFGLIGFIDGRLSRSVNISANFGYILNSNPKSDFGGSREFVLLDRPDEIIAGVGFDFPVTKHFQPVMELRSTQYVAGRTPNAFENSPVDGLLGMKIYPRRWWGLGLAYRRHLNQQDRSLFGGRNFNTQINQISGIFVPGRGIVIVPGTTRPATTNGFPNGFNESDDPNGFIVQLWAGRRNVREIPREIVEFDVKLSSPDKVVLPAHCKEYEKPVADCIATPADSRISISATLENATSAPERHPENKTPLTEAEKSNDFSWTWLITDGPDKEKVKLTPAGANATLDLSDPAIDLGGKEVYYTVTATAEYGCGTGTCVRTATTTVTVKRCPCYACPTITVTCPDKGMMDKRGPLAFTANVYYPPGAAVPEKLGYTWKVKGGVKEEVQDVELTPAQQGYPTITIDATKLDPKLEYLIATVTVSGLPPDCPYSASSDKCYFSIVYDCKKFDEYGPIQYNDEKARLDNFAIELQRDPRRTVGYIVAYRGRADTNIGTRKIIVTGDICPEYRTERAKRYLVDCRSLSSGQIQTVDGGDREFSSVELWVCPINRTPTATPDTRIQRSSAPCVNKELPSCSPGGPSPPTGSIKKPRKHRRKKATLGS